MIVLKFVRDIRDVIEVSKILIHVIFQVCHLFTEILSFLVPLICKSLNNSNPYKLWYSK